MYIFFRLFSKFLNHSFFSKLFYIVSILKMYFFDFSNMFLTRKKKLLKNYVKTVKTRLRQNFPKIMIIHFH